MIEGILNIEVDSCASIGEPRTVHRKKVPAILSFVASIVHYWRSNNRGLVTI